MFLRQIFMYTILIYNIQFLSGTQNDDYDHPRQPRKLTKSVEPSENSFRENLEADSTYWNSKAQRTLTAHLEAVLNENKAKNIIFFLGDGMGFVTTAATRMYIKSEETELAFEKFPHVGLSKTYCVDAQVADSACTATAYLCGVKGNFGTIGVNADAVRYNCTAHLDTSTYTESIASWAQKAGKGTGIITTTRITHASPAGAFAHIANRNWESDYGVRMNECDPELVDDIAEQLIYNDVGKKFKVILGGGRGMFFNDTQFDEEGKRGGRMDGKDLIEDWKIERSKVGKASYVWNRDGLNAVNYDDTEYLLGLFENDHFQFNLDIIKNNQQKQLPSLADMTASAIKMLAKEKNGYFLFVEGGRIDSALHENRPRKALEETKEFSAAVELARQMTSEQDTLIVVTADHSHVMTYNGQQDRGSDIMGIAENSDLDFLPFSTLSFGNGPGYDKTYNADGSRYDISNDDFSDINLRYPATVPRTSETHGGEDVGVYASGPMAHLFTGSYEQSAIPILLAYAAEIGPYAGASKVIPAFIIVVTQIFFFVKFTL